LDENLIIDTANNYKKLISIEDNTASGGAGSAINELLQSKNIKTPLHIIGVPDLVTEHGSQDELYGLYGLNEESIINASKI
jgi:1-deoxy-D-xylulose-5-phosphate synthase